MRPALRVEFKGALTTATHQLHWVSLALQQIPPIKELHTCHRSTLTLSHSETEPSGLQSVGASHSCFARVLFRAPVHGSGNPPADTEDRTTAQSVLSCTWMLMTYRIAVSHKHPASSQKGSEGTHTDYLSAVRPQPRPVVRPECVTWIK